MCGKNNTVVVVVVMRMVKKSVDVYIYYIYCYSSEYVLYETKEIVVVLDECSKNMVFNIIVLKILHNSFH